MPRADSQRLPDRDNLELERSGVAPVFPLRHAAIAGIAAALVLLLLIAVASYRSIEAFEARVRWVDQSHGVLVGLEELFANYAEARSSWWAYIASGDELRLRAFNASAVDAEQNLDELRLKIIVPAQRARFLVLEQLVREDLSKLRDLSAARGETAFEPSGDLMYEMLSLLSRVRELQFALVDAERDILEGRRADFGSAGAAIRGTIVVGYGLGLLLLVVSLLYLYRETQARQRAQQKALDLNRALNERATALQEINRELEEFSYSVSHDLRAPIRAISSFSHILEEEYGSTLDAEGLRLLGVVSRNAERMGRLIDDLLAFSRVGRQAITLVPVDMNALVQEVIAGFRVDSRDTIRARFEIGPLPQVEADASLLRQVWTNLIDNALKYTNKTAQPLIRINGQQLKDGCAEYSIEDNGSGFDMEYADKLFEVFQRLHDAHEFPGTGVGLAIVKRIIDRHGGRLRAESEPGRGARFSFALPQHEENPGR